MPSPRGSRDTVALILAVSFAAGVLLVTGAILWAVIRSETATIDETASQLLVLLFGGLIGILGSYVGHKAKNGENGR
jgi:cytochrome b subunit of formate dehydrogenase